MLKVDEIVTATLPLLTRADTEAGAFLYLVGPQGDWLHLRGVSGFVSSADLRERVPVEVVPLPGEAPSDRGTLALFRSPDAAASIQRLACASVRGDEGVRGLLALVRRTGRELGPAERTLLEATAALVASGLDRVRLAELLERAKEQLVDVSRLVAVGQLVPSVAHQVNNPLTTVLGHTQLLLTRPDLGEHLRQRLEIMATEGARAARLIQNLLAFARTRPSDRHSCSLTDQVRRVLELKAHQLYQDGVRVVTEYDDGPAVHADEREIQHALLALVERAHQAMRERSNERVLTVRTGAGSGRVWAEVHDTGAVVGPEVMDSLADPLATSSTRGSGMALAHRIVTDHGGQLRASVHPEGGATFSIVLPAEASSGR